MAVVKADIKAAILVLYDAMDTGAGCTKDQCADAMADIIRNAIQSGDVTGIGNCAGTHAHAAGATKITGTIA